MGVVPLLKSSPTINIMNPFPQSLPWAQMHLRSFLTAPVGPWNETSLPRWERLILCRSNLHHRPCHCRIRDLATGKKQPASRGCALHLQLVSLTTSLPESKTQLAHIEACISHIYTCWEETCAWLKRVTCRPSWILKSRQRPMGPSHCSRHVPVVYPSARKIKGTVEEAGEKCQENCSN